MCWRRCQQRHLLPLPLRRSQSWMSWQFRQNILLPVHSCQVGCHAWPQSSGRSQVWGWTEHDLGFHVKRCQGVLHGNPLSKRTNKLNDDWRVLRSCWSGTLAATPRHRLIATHSANSLTLSIFYGAGWDGRVRGGEGCREAYKAISFSDILFLT